MPEIFYGIMKKEIEINGAFSLSSLLEKTIEPRNRPSNEKGE